MFLVEQPVRLIQIMCARLAVRSVTSAPNPGPGRRRCGDGSTAHARDRPLVAIAAGLAITATLRITEPIFAAPGMALGVSDRLLAGRQGVSRLAGVDRPNGFDQQDVGLVLSPGAVFDAARHDEEFSWEELHIAVPELNRQLAV